VSSSLELRSSSPALWGHVGTLPSSFSSVVGNCPRWTTFVSPACPHRWSVPVREWWRLIVVTSEVVLWVLASSLDPRSRQGDLALVRLESTSADDVGGQQ
jgi:hypothetical protein